MLGIPPAGQLPEIGFVLHPRPPGPRRTPELALFDTATSCLSLPRRSRRTRRKEIRAAEGSARLPWLLGVQIPLFLSPWSPCPPWFTVLKKGARRSLVRPNISSGSPPRAAIPISIDVCRDPYVVQKPKIPHKFSLAGPAQPGASRGRKAEGRGRRTGHKPWACNPNHQSSIVNHQSRGYRLLLSRRTAFRKARQPLINVGPGNRPFCPYQASTSQNRFHMRSLSQRLCRPRSTAIPSTSDTGRS
jgi:hypothetical protein